MKLFTNETALLKLFLWLIAIHSFLVGALLIVFPPDLLAFFGFEVIEKFFSTQGGVFHIVMSIAYIIAAVNLGKSDLVIYFSISAKFVATVFLFSYFLFKNQIWMVLFSGLGDFLMAVILLVLFINYKKNRNAS